MPGGAVVILEIGRPRYGPAKFVVKIFMGWIVPAISAVVSLDGSGWRLMRYFWETVDRCVPPERVVEALEAAGFVEVARSVEFGILNVYTGRKPEYSAPPATTGAQ